MTQDLEWARSLLEPELPVYDENDHELAKLRFIIGELSEELFRLWAGTKPDGYMPFKTKDEAHRHIENYCYNERGSVPEGNDQEEIDMFAARMGWEQWRAEHESGTHMGDCTAFPASCMKCRAEGYYMFEGPRYTKSVGSKASNLLIQEARQFANQRNQEDK